ncbi:cytochrome P450 [Seonamhaeicola maritimus]|uniref:Cytochrome P450 n=1 Tax=Seonamhaeicola maritimus TaxID=2591822 RepID=A0A5C7GJX5_9FLAO|nr:cytochrome P450 [Seonamhaeicola maritimus]TXG38668.1 cytochrome P450 [Seonamhaeicola maritimus]
MKAANMDVIKVKGPNFLNFLNRRNEYPAFHFHDLMHKYGAVVKCSHLFYLVNDADVGKEILLKDLKYFNQQDFISKRTRAVFGEGLVTNEGASWASQRKLLYSVFRYKSVHESINETITTINDYLDECVSPFSDKNELIDIAKEMEHLTIMISGKVFFDTDLKPYIPDVQNIVLTSTKYMSDGLPFYIPLWVPTKTHLSLKNLGRRVDNILSPLLSKRLKSKRVKPDLIHALLQGLGSPDLFSKNRRLIIDEMKTMLAGAYFPTSSTLSLFWLMMGQNPKCFQKIKHEIKNTPEGYTFTSRFYKDFPETTKALFETMRLYPSAFSIWRKTKQKCTIKGYVFPKGKSVCISMLNIHRNPKYWKNPEEFNPERFNEINSKNRPKHYFMPFGWGPRKCIGDYFSIMVMHLAIIKILGKFDVEIIENQKLIPRPLAILCPDKVIAKIKSLDD